MPGGTQWGREAGAPYPSCIYYAPVYVAESEPIKAYPVNLRD